MTTKPDQRRQEPPMTTAETNCRVRVTDVRVTTSEDGIRQATVHGFSASDMYSANAAVHRLASMLGIRPGFDTHYTGEAEDGNGSVWHIIELLP